MAVSWRKDSKGRLLSNALVFQPPGEFSWSPEALSVFPFTLRLCWRAHIIIVGYWAFQKAGREGGFLGKLGSVAWHSHNKMTLSLNQMFKLF